MKILKAFRYLLSQIKQGRRYFVLYYVNSGHWIIYVYKNASLGENDVIGKFIVKHGKVCIEERGKCLCDPENRPYKWQTEEK